jgi:hypothetical protein
LCNGQQGPRLARPRATKPSSSLGCPIPTFLSEIECEAMIENTLVVEFSRLTVSY